MVLIPPSVGPPWIFVIGRFNNDLASVTEIGQSCLDPVFSLHHVLINFFGIKHFGINLSRWSKPGG